MTLDTSLDLVIYCNESSCIYKCTLETLTKLNFVISLKNKIT